MTMGHVEQSGLAKMRVQVAVTLLKSHRFYVPEKGPRHWSMP